jgi:hypothetical protein
MQQDPLSQLRDIHIPEPGGFWPPAPGWWFVLLVLITVIVLITLMVRRHRRRNAWYRFASRDLEHLAGRAEMTSEWFSELNALLKQSALARYPERQPQSLTGPDWVECLVQTSPDDPIASRPLITALVESCYQPSPGCATDDAIRFVRLWMEGQRC